MQTANVKKPGEFEAKAQGDIIFNNGGGFNMSTHVVTGLAEHLFDVDAFIGAGTTDFQIGALFKYNLLPDMPGQIGVSFLGGVSYLRDNVGTVSINSTLLSLGALVSKGFQADGLGHIEPYFALQIEPLINSLSSTAGITVLIGSEWRFIQTTPWFFYSEFAFGVKNSNYALNLGAGYAFK